MPDQKGPAEGQERIGIVVIHGVGEAEPGWINDYVVDRLAKVAPELTFDAHSEVHRLGDAGSVEKDRTFAVHARRGRDGDGRRLMFLELFWADLSRIGTGSISSTIAAIRLFYEAPMVFGSSSLHRSQSGLLGLLRHLILLANWVLRWPITGTNVAAFACSAIVLVLQQLYRIEPLAPLLGGINIVYPIASTLLLLSIVGLAFGRHLAHRDIALANVGLSTFVFSLLLLAALVADTLRSGPKGGNFDQSPAVYLLMAANVIMPLWLVWSVLVVLAILLLGALALARRLRLVEPGSVPLERPAAALGLSTVQGMIWKIVVSLLWVLVIAAVVRGVLDHSQCPGYLDECQRLGRLSIRLGIIALSNTAMALVLVLALLTVVWQRRLWQGLYGPGMLEQRVQAPRLIVSRLVIAVMFLITLFNFYGFYGPRAMNYLNGWLGTRMVLPLDFYAGLEQLAAHRRLREALAFIAGGGATGLLMFLFRSVQAASRPLLHIARDLVDHQYTPGNTFSQRFLPSANRFVGEFPRRDRIQRRLSTLMRQVAAVEHFDRVLFIAHSQGTVILYDYLMSRRDAQDLADARRIDVVTLASPLTHIYEHYFPLYDAASRGLNPKIASWSNYWRIDDPIGNRIDFGLVDNVALPAGGHVDYWREEQVCKAILDLVRGTAAGTTPAAAGLTQPAAAGDGRRPPPDHAAAGMLPIAPVLR